MSGGRPTQDPRTAFGQRVRAAREAVGFSQAYVAEQLGITQSSYAHWERHRVALRADQIEQLAKILKVSTDYLFGHIPPKMRQTRPSGRSGLIFEAVAQLPRRQQQKILEVVSALVAQQTGRQVGVA